MEAGQLTREQLTDLLRDSRDHAKYCRESLRVLDRLGSREPMELWPSQKKLNDTILAQRRLNKPVRILILKTRRSGFTLGVCGHMFKDVTSMPGRKATVIADKYKPAGLEAFNYLKHFQENYVPFERHDCKMFLPDLMAMAEGKHLEWDGDRRAEVLSAESREVRGGGRHFVLGDELAFWEAPEVTLPGLLGMVPELPETTIILQSTANGVGGEFWRLWHLYSDPLTASGWVTLFFGWLEHPLYQAPVDDPVKFEASLDDEEKMLRSLHNARLEQLAWRRNIIQTQLGGSVDMFHQEYPTTPEEAFLTTGRPALDSHAIAAQPAADGAVGELKIISAFPRDRLIFQADASRQGSLEIFKQPQPNRQYVMGADPSKGVDVSTAKRGEDPDYAVAIVADADTGEQVARLRARIRPGAFAKYVALLGRFYNWAYIVPESNDAGFIDALLETTYAIERLYEMERDPTDRKSTRLKEIGFETTTLTRSWLVTAIDDALMDGSIIVHGRVDIMEMRTFVIKPNGKAEHAVGCHDDCVLAWALLVIGLRRFARLRLKPVQLESGRAKLITRYGAPKKEDDD